MAGRPSKKAKEAKAQAEANAKSFDEFGGDEGYAEDVPEIEDQNADPRRDWRDVEKYREARDLKRLVDEDIDAYFFKEEKPRPGRR